MLNFTSIFLSGRNIYTSLATVTLCSVSEEMEDVSFHQRTKRKWLWPWRRWEAVCRKTSPTSSINNLKKMYWLKSVNMLQIVNLSVAWLPLKDLFNLCWIRWKVGIGMKLLIIYYDDAFSSSGAAAAGSSPGSSRWDGGSDDPSLVALSSTSSLLPVNSTLPETLHPS